MILFLSSAETDNNTLLPPLNESGLEYRIIKQIEDIEDHEITESTIVCSALLCSEHLPFLIKFLAPRNIPLLFLGIPSSENLEVFSQSSTFIDFLPIPLTGELLRHKVRFLRRLGACLSHLDKARQDTDRYRQERDKLAKSVDWHSAFLDNLSQRDGLTGLLNRRSFTSHIRDAYEEAKKQRLDLSLIILNIDYFSEINKSCGQDFGDFVLNELAARITTSIGENDTAFRLSGEDFAISMKNCPLYESVKCAENLRHIIETKDFDNGHYHRTITLSLGVANLQDHQPTTHEELLQMADQALFVAKAEGRNRVMQYSAINHSSLGQSEQSHRIFQDTITKILIKTKISTLRSLELLAQGLAQRDESSQVTQTQTYMQLLCQEMNLPQSLIDTFKNSATLLNTFRQLLHNSMINKEEELSSNDWEILFDFPYQVEQIIHQFDYFSSERNILLHHAERYDGSGYPEGLQGDEIPIGARIFALVSAVSAMNADRPYRTRLSPQEILDELCTNAGKQFDPQLVIKFLEVIEGRDIIPLSEESLATAKQHIRKHLPL